MTRRDNQHQTVKSAWKGTVASLAGGLAGAWVMNKFQMGLSKLSEQNESGTSQKPSHEGDDATVKAASAISEAVLDHRLTQDEKRVAGPAVHYSFGAAMAPSTAWWRKWHPSRRRVGVSRLVRRSG